MVHTRQWVQATLAVILLLSAQIACFEKGLSDRAPYGDLGLFFASNRSQAQVGEPVNMRFSVINRGSQSIVLESQNTPVMDISVKVVGGPRLFAWSAQNPDKIAHRLEWKPGESKTIELVWIPRQEDVRIGVRHNIFLTGLLYEDGKIVQSAGVTVCASNTCE